MLVDTFFANLSFVVFPIIKFFVWTKRSRLLARIKEEWYLIGRKKRAAISITPIVIIMCTFSFKHQSLMQRMVNLLSGFKSKLSN